MSCSKSDDFNSSSSCLFNSHIKSKSHQCVILFIQKIDAAEKITVFAIHGNDFHITAKVAHAAIIHHSLSNKFQKSIFLKAFNALYLNQSSWLEAHSLFSILCFQFSTIQLNSYDLRLVLRFLSLLVNSFNLLNKSHILVQTVQYVKSEFKSISQSLLIFAH
jgi:hypothetical protein